MNRWSEVDIEDRSLALFQAERIVKELEAEIEKLEGDLAEEELPALWEALHDRNVRIEELETQKVIADAHNEDALAFIKQKGLFDEYYEGAGDWEQQR